MCAPNIQITHAFTTRIGGVSTGVFSTLNLGANSGDDPSSVRGNYEIVCRAINISSDDLIGTRQVHGNSVRIVKREDRGKLFLRESIEADGMITNEQGVALIVFTADCVPVLLQDPVCSVISAVHSGWRGTAQDIVGSAVRKMSEAYGSSPINIRAAIGPSISKCCYETDSDVANALCSTLSDDVAECCISMRGDKYMVDLKEANRILLKRAGLTDIAVSEECTSCNSCKYWSHRRTKGHRGSQAAIIAL